MSVALEVLLPLRNSTEALRATVDSLLAQTDRGFRVLVGSQDPQADQASISSMVEQLRSAGITAQGIQPPFELREVELWNWLCRQSTAAWIAPLLAGDSLGPHAVQRWKEAISGFPESRFIHWGYVIHKNGSATELRVAHCESRFRSAAELHESIFRFGEELGPPGTTLFLRDAWLGTGGYRQTLPVEAHYLLGCELARRFGVVGIPEALSHVQERTAPRGVVLKQKLTGLGMLAYHAWTEKRSVSMFDLARLLAGELAGFFSTNENRRRVW